MFDDDYLIVGMGAFAGACGAFLVYLAVLYYNGSIY